MKATPVFSDCGSKKNMSATLQQFMAMLMMGGYITIVRKKKRF